MQQREIDRKPRRPGTGRERPERHGVGARLILAALATLAGGVTLLAYGALAVYAGSIPALLAVFSPAGIAFLGICAVAGFLTTPDGLASFFSFFWGTHPVWESPRFQKLATFTLFIVLLGVLARELSR